MIPMSCVAVATCMSHSFVQIVRQFEGNVDGRTLLGKHLVSVAYVKWLNFLLRYLKTFICIMSLTAAWYSSFVYISESQWTSK